MEQHQTRNDASTTLNIAELYDIWPVLPPSERRERFRHLSCPVAKVFFLDLAPHDQAELVRQPPLAEQQLWMQVLAPDDTADVIQEAPAEEHAELLALLEASVREDVLKLLTYAEDHAGGLMSPTLPAYARK